MFTDGTRSETPQIQYVKFLRADGEVFTDSTAGDFLRAESLQNLTKAPYQSYTPYFGLSRAPNGGFRTSGTYLSRPIDGGPGAVWERLRWRLPTEIANTDPGLVALYHLDGNWVDVVPAGGANNPSAQNNTAFSSAARLGFNAAQFSENTGGSTVSNFFSAAQNIASLSFWIKPENMSDGILEVGGGAISIRDHQIVTAGYGANSPQIFVNANPQASYLQPGWNHVVLVWPSAINAQQLLVGRANGDYFNGLLDELALYTTVLTMGQVQVQYYNAHPISSGVASFRVRAAANPTALASATWVGPFSDPATASFSLSGRYVQYEIAFAGDGSGTPAVGNVRVEGQDGATTFSIPTLTLAEAAAGDFGGGAVAWYGDEIYVDNFAATDPSNLLQVDFEGSDLLAGLWHFDEPVWDSATVLVDSSGKGRSGNAVNGAASSPNARLGFRSGSFDGVNQYVELSQIPELAAGDFSVGLWFNTRDTREGALISTYAGGGASFMELALNNDGSAAATGRVAFVIDDGVNGVRSVVSPAENMNNGAWRHVVGVRAGGYLHLYVDGVRVASTSIGGTYGSIAAGTPYVMRNGIGGNRYLAGNVDEVVIFGSALSPQKVGTVFASGYSTARINEVILEPVDAGGPTIWQTLRWTSDGIYGNPLSPAATVRGLWHMDESSGSTAQDASGNNRHATLTGTTPVAGVFDGAREFNGVNDLARVTHVTALESGVFSVELWAKPVSLNNRALIFKRSGSNGYALFTDAIGRLTFQIGSSSLVDNQPLLAGVWQHVVATYNGAVMRLYVNGELRGSLVPTGAIVASAADLYIGSAAAGMRFGGVIDEVAYHARTLLDAEILDHYRAVAGTLKFQVRAGNELPLSDSFYGPDGTANTYFTRLQDNNLVGVVPLVQYLQVKAFIGTADHRFSPTFYGLGVSASSYPVNAPWIAPVTAQAFPFPGRLLDFEQTRTFDAENTTSVRYQISGDPGAASTNRWFFYNSSSGRWTQQDPLAGNVFLTQANDFTTVKSQIGKFYEQVYNAAGGLFRFKAFLKSGGDQPIALSNVTVTASSGRVVVTSPNGLERGRDAWIAAVPYPVIWSWEGTVSDNLEVAYSVNGYNGPWTTIATGVAKGPGGTNSVIWTTPEPPLLVPSLTNVVVRIRDLNDATIEDHSDAPFEITQRFKLTEPNGGERWYVGEQNTIRWESAHNLSTFVSLYMAPDGDNFDPAAGGYEIVFLASNINASANNSYVWDTPRHEASLLSTNAKLRVQAAGGGFEDESDESFSMVGVVVTSPTAGQKVKRGDPFPIQWRAMSAGTNVSVDISLDGGVTFEPDLFDTVPNADGNNSLVWDVTHPESDFAVLRIRSLTDNRIIGLSQVFTIAGIDVLAPDGGEEWLSGSTRTIQWVAGGAGDSVNIYFTDLYEGTNTIWTPIALNTPNTLSYNWLVSERVSPQARVKVQSIEDANLFAESEQNFSIAGVRVTYPNVFGENQIMGQQTVMTHAGAPPRWQQVKLEISYDRETTWQTLGAGASSWTLRQPYFFTPTFPSRQAKVRATVLNATAEDQITPLTNIVDTSDEYFEVHGMLMEAPMAGSTHTMGTQSEIRWVSAGAGTTATILYSNQGTNNFQVMVQGLFNNQTYPGRNPYPWMVPGTLLPSENARVRVVSGSYQTTSPSFTLRGIRMTAPTNNAVIPIGSEFRSEWIRAGMDIASQGTLSLSLDGGQTFEVLENNYSLISLPFYNWPIDPDLAPSTAALLRLEILSSPTAADVGFAVNSDRFTLKGIKILSPAPGGNVALGATTPIEFIAAAAGSSAKIEYSANGGSSWDTDPVFQNVQIVNGLNSFNWQVETTRTPSTNAVIRVTGTADSKVSGVFTLGGIRVDRPMQYDIWAVGEINPIRWVAQVNEAVFNIDLLYPDGTVRQVAQNALGSELNYPLPPGALLGQSTISNVVLRVADRQNTAIGFSPPFRLVSQPIVEMVSPQPGDYLPVGEDVQVTWVKGGSMQAEDFSIWFLQDGNWVDDGFGRPVILDTGNNTFSTLWLVPDRLGSTRIMITNSVNPTLTTYSGDFDIVGNFDLEFPIGAAAEDDIYANQQVGVSWFTQGTVAQVNLFYQIESQGWVKANTAPIPNNPQAGRYQTVYQWTAPTVRTDEILVRVQDASYPDPDLFDGTRTGPYDQSDNPFALNYFTVNWEVKYMDTSTGTNEFKHLDKLSVTDSSGWSVTGVESPFVTNYPFGVFDTVWYRQFFNDKVDFRWVSDRDQTRSLLLQPSDTEPDAYVMASFVYRPNDEMLVIHSWIERGGRVLNNPDKTTVRFYRGDGTLIETRESHEVKADGFFRIEWDISDELALGELTKDLPLSQQQGMRVGETYLGRVEVMYNRVIYSAAVTYTLSLAPDLAAIEIIRDDISALDDSLTGQMTNLTAVTEDFRDRALGSLGRIEEQTGQMVTNINEMAAQLGDFTNTVIAPLSMLTNQFVDILGPALTNMTNQVQDILEATAGEQARILNRPTTVEYGSTNTILYRTSRGLDPGTVRLTVEGTGRQFNMLAVGETGIYSVDIIADWGLGSTVISCSDPLASDRMVLEVVMAGAGSMGELAETVVALEKQLSGMAEVLTALGGEGGGLSDILGSIGQVEAALGAAISGGGGAAGVVSELESLLGVGDPPGASSLWGRLAGMSGRIDEIFGSASDAARFALGAKNEAGTAANTARELMDLLSGEFSPEEAMGRMENIRRSMEQVASNVENIPQAMGVQTLQSQLQAVAHQIEEMARRQDYELEVRLTEAGTPGVGGAEGTEAADEEIITVLNQNMNEVKISLEFMQRVLDEKMNEPVVMESWLGVE